MKDDEVEVAMFMGLVVPAVLVGLVFLHGLVLWAMWSWFVVPLGVREIGFAHAVGLSCVISLFQHKGEMVKEHPVAYWVMYVMVFVIALFCWLMM